jgi:ADP-heptose:LPS heptosyltransferase
MVASLFAEIIRGTPDIKITYLVRRNAPFIAGLVAAYPEVIVVPVPQSPFDALKATLPLFKERAVVIAPPPWGVRPLSLKLLSFIAKLRGDKIIAFDDGGVQWFYSATIIHDKAKRYIDNLRAAATLASFTTAALGEPPRLKMETALPAGFPFTDQPYIAIHPFPHMATFKTLPLRRWKTLMCELAERYPGYRLVITGAEIDRAQAEELAAVVPGAYLAIDRPLTEVAGIIERTKLYIGVDTGPTHIAGVLHAPSLVLAQQKEPMWLPTYNPNATLISAKERCTCGTSVPCEALEEGRSYRRCVYDLTDETILGAVSSVLPHANLEG